MTPAATWPGLPLAALQVYAPLDAGGALWGTREHDQLYVQARFPNEPHESHGSVRYVPMTVDELCYRLPPGARLGLGKSNRLVDCANSESLKQMPTQLDLSRLSRQSRVRLLADVPELRQLMQAVDLSDALLVEVVDLDARVGGTLMVTDVVTTRRATAFAEACASSQPSRPLQLWAEGDLPRWLRKQLVRAVQGPAGPKDQPGQAR